MVELVFSCTACKNEFRERIPVEYGKDVFMRQLKEVFDDRTNLQMCDVCLGKYRMDSRKLQDIHAQQKSELAKKYGLDL